MARSKEMAVADNKKRGFLLGTVALTAALISGNGIASSVPDGSASVSGAAPIVQMAEFVIRAMSHSH